jgi:hypothetical protein
VAALVWGTANIFILVFKPVVILRVIGNMAHLDSNKLPRILRKSVPMLCQLGPHFPRLRKYEEIFQDSDRIQKSISTFYSIVIVIFTQSLKAIQVRGNEIPANIYIYDIMP